MKKSSMTVPDQDSLESKATTSGEEFSVIKHFSTDAERGLTSEQAIENLKQYGPNQLTARKPAGPMSILVRQFQSTVVVLLLLASLASWLSHETVQAIAILAAVLINAAVGFITELKAKFSLEALENLAGPVARVIRDGRERDLPAAELVPGDLIVLDAGARVPADLVLTETVALSVEEGMLSGESIPVYKQAEGANGSDDTCMAYQGTLILSGRALGVVCATGNNTKLGKLGQLLSNTISTRTPLEYQLEKLGQQLTWLTLVLCAILFFLGFFNKAELWHMLQTSIALAVAAIPEGMPVVATLALAAGTGRMVKCGALIRQLAAVETLGCTTVICTDKTGTLTENQMLVTDLILPERHIHVSGKGYEPIGILTENGSPVSDLDEKMLVDLLLMGSLCNDARLEFHDGHLQWHVHGDPTEGAILAAAGKIGIKHEQLKLDYPRIFELPFDLNRKRMTSVHRNDKGEIFTTTKGSPGTIIGLSSYVASPSGTRAMTEEDRQWYIEQNEYLASRGLRVLAVAMAPLRELHANYRPEIIENNLILLGLIAMADQARDGVKTAIKACRDAGIRVIMVTGDQAATASAIASSLNILDPQSPKSHVLTGAQLETMSETELQTALQEVQVLARVTPEAKLRVVRALQQSGEIVAMTGDGVNDAPALRQSNIGVAMGKSGTALAREASAIVITDDNFASIAKAVEQGRIIYANIRQAIAYLLTASLSSVLAVFATVMTGAGTPFSPILLLWLNLIMHIFPGLAVVLQPGAAGIMNESPRESKEQLLSSAIQLQILFRSFIVCSAAIAAMTLAPILAFKDSSTIGFATLSLSLLLQAISWAMVQRGISIGQFKTLCNSAMLINMPFSLLLLLLAIYLPPLQTVLGTNALSAIELGFVFMASVLSMILTELVRLSSKPLTKVRA